MQKRTQSASDFATISSVAATGKQSATAPCARVERDGQITVGELADRYMRQYAGRDESRGQRVGYWCAKLGDVRLADLSDDAIFFALQDLATERGRYWCGRDADGRPIYKAKHKALSTATLNRYAAALGAVITWSIKQRIAPRGFDNPCRRVQRQAERNGRVRFLSDDERARLLAACRSSQWPLLYLLVLLAITTGARRGELERLRWNDVDVDRAVATLHETKNGDRRVLPLVTAVVEELRKRGGAPSALVFASRRRPDQAYNHVPAWHVALKSARVRDFRFHDLRHSCASYLAQSGATLVQIADVLGHRNLAVTRRYSHLATAHKADLVHKVLGDFR
jgi:integrase